MKKFAFLVIVLVLSAVCITGAGTVPFLNFEFTSTTDKAVYKGDVVECSVKFSDIEEPGLSSVDLLFSYSSGLSFNDDVTAILPEGFELWKPNVNTADRTLRLVAIDETVVTPGKTDLEIKFSFTVTSDTRGFEEVKLLKGIISDFDCEEREDISKTFLEEPFLVNPPKVENIGASLRVNNTPALRFGAKAENADGYEIKMLVCEDSDTNLTLDTEGALVYDLTVTGDILSSAPVEITSSTKEYTFRPFVSADGHIIYYEALVRSAKSVAQTALTAETDERMRELLLTFCTNS